MLLFFYRIEQNTTFHISPNHIFASPNPLITQIHSTIAEGQAVGDNGKAGDTGRRRLLTQLRPCDDGSSSSTREGRHSAVKGWEDRQQPGAQELAAGGTGRWRLLLAPTAWRSHVLGRGALLPGARACEGGGQGAESREGGGTAMGAAMLGFFN
jgi:hypothetical protein